MKFYSYTLRNSWKLNDFPKTVKVWLDRKSLDRVKFNSHTNMLKETNKLQKEIGSNQRICALKLNCCFNYYTVKCENTEPSKLRPWPNNLNLHSKFFLLQKHQKYICERRISSQVLFYNADNAENPNFAIN